MEAIFLLVFCLLPAYFIPAMVAGSRDHRNKLAISMLNLFAGWTIVGWIVALVWACTNDVVKSITVGVQE